MFSPPHLSDDHLAGGSKPLEAVAALCTSSSQTGAAGKNGYHLHLGTTASVLGQQGSAARSVPSIPEPRIAQSPSMKTSDKGS